MNNFILPSVCFIFVDFLAEVWQPELVAVAGQLVRLGQQLPQLPDLVAVHSAVRQGGQLKKNIIGIFLKIYPGIYKRGKIIRRNNNPLHTNI